MTHEIARLNVLRTARLALVLAMAAGTAGCFASGRIRGDIAKGAYPGGNSPVARDVAYASQHPGPYPKFSDIPKIPTDLRPPAAWREAVVGLQARRDALEAETAALPPPPSDTEAYAAGNRTRAAADPADVPPPDAAQQTETYARSLRERATPPPTPK